MARPEDFTHREVLTPRGRMHFVEAGKGKPLLLLHGGHGGWVHWIDNIHALAGARRVIAPDLPGFGLSDPPVAAPELPDHVAAVQGFVEALGLHHIDVGAFSFGTTVATTLINESQVRVNEGRLRVDRLALVSPPGLGTISPESSALPQRSSAAARRGGFRAGVENTMRELMLCNHQRVTDDLLDMMVEYVGLTKYSTGPISIGYRMLDAMRQLDLPTLVLIGDHDPFQNHELALRLANVREALRGVDARIVNRAAHWIQYDQPALVGQVLLEFFGPG